MFKSARLSLVFLMGLALTTVTVSGCSSAQKKDAQSATSTIPQGDENTLGDSDSGRAMGLQTIYFEYDSFLLGDSAKGVLKQNAAILKTNGSLKIQIEGHCDNRGGIQYNIALGEKRANAVKSYLRDMGIAADRMTTISYGKERLVDHRDTEDAHGKNRRANFVITSK